MKLVLAEKPSVAQSIAKVLGAAKREDGYLEGNGYVVSWCVGHLVELAQPEVYDAKYSKWAYSWKSAYKCCVLCNWFIALGHWRICDLLHCKGFVAVPAYSCGSWNCDNSSGVLARLGCYESREYWRKSGSIYQVIR